MSKFDELYNKVLNRVNEDVPVTLMPGIEGGRGEVPAAFPEKANYTLTPAQVSDVIGDVVDYLLTRNRHSPLPYKLFQTDVIADKIMGRSSLNRTKAGYAARVVHNSMIEAGIITDERSGTSITRTPTEEEVETIADTVSRETEEITSNVSTDKSANIDIEDDFDAEEASTYHKAKDFPAELDDEGLEAKWNLIPDDTDIEWPDLLKTVGLKDAERLKGIGAIVPVLPSKDDGDYDEDSGEIPTLDEPVSDDEYPDLREIEPDIYRRSPYRDFNY
jgi:hypothetical protein